MAAGLGFKTFATGDVLSATDVNGYLMQGILVFASAAARDAAITSPEEGQFAYLKDTNVTTYYTGSAWANVDTTGMTNPMTTTGDVIYSSSGSTPARLGIGTAGQVLTVNAGATAPEWAAPAAGGGWTSISSGNIPTGTNILTLSSISASYKDLELVLLAWSGSGNNTLVATINNDATAVYATNVVQITAGSSSAFGDVSYSNMRLSGNASANAGNNKNMTRMYFPNYTNATTGKVILSTTGFQDSGSTRSFVSTNNYYSGANAAISRIDVTYGSNYSGGTYILYGVN
jgi:hypothetical protein